MEAIVIALGKPLQLHAETLSLKTPHPGYRTQKRQSPADKETSSTVTGSVVSESAMQVAERKNISGPTQRCILGVAIPTRQARRAH